MRLHREYLLRHKLDVPVVQYDQRSLVFLSSKHSPATWRVITFVWRHVEHHPGFFEYSCLTPIHNGIRNRELFRDSSATPVYWDHYEEKVLSVVEEMRRDFVAVPSEEHFFAAWKMFLLTCDFTLACRMMSDFLALVEGSIRPDCDALERLNKQQQAEVVLKERLSEVYDIWKYHFVPLTSLHSKWLEELFK